MIRLERPVFSLELADEVLSEYRAIYLFNRFTEGLYLPGTVPCPVLDSVVGGT